MLKAIYDQAMGLILLGALGLLGALWFAGYIGWKEDGREALPEAQGQGRAQDAVVVTVAPVSFRGVQRTVGAVGTLYGFEEVSISAKCEGRVVKVLQDVSDRVGPGELLLEVDPTDTDLAAQQAERSLQVELAKLGMASPPEGTPDLSKVPYVVQARARSVNAQAKYERLKRLSRSGSASDEEVDLATSDYRAAQAELAHQTLMAKAGLATVRMKQSDLTIARQKKLDTRAHAPVPTLPVPGAAGGVSYAITQRFVSEGSYVRPGTELFRLVIPRTLKLRVPVPERHTREVRVGQKARVTTSAYPKAFTGQVARINPAVDPVSRTFEVEVQVPNPDDELKPGGFARAEIQTRQEGDVPTVPLSALVTFAGITKVYLVKDGKAVEVQVVPGVQTTEWVEIASPRLPRGGTVITSGQTVVADRTPVTVREEMRTAVAKE
jgi:multidrug efflux pump subunit AcrA (membrane-fusion protein)